MKYEVTYLTVNGMFSMPSRTLAEAKADAARLKALNKQPGYTAAGIRISKIGEL